MPKKFTITLRTIHLIAALILGLYLTLICLSGSVLVFKKELMGWLHPQWTTVQSQGHRIGLSKILNSYNKANPDSNILLMGLPQKANETVAIWDGPMGWGQRRTFINPYNGSVVGQHNYTSVPLNLLEYLHIALLIGGSEEIGVKINAWLGIASLILLLTGFVLWWPKRLSQIKSRLKVKWRSHWIRINWDLHHALGIWSLPVLMFLCLTGVAAVFPAQVKSTVRFFSGENTKAPAALVAKKETHVKKTSAIAAAAKVHHTPLTLDQLVANATASVPGSKPAIVLYPDKNSRPLFVYLHPPGDTQGNLFISTLVDRKNGKVLKVINPMDNLPGATAAMMLPLHVGSTGGLPMKIVWFIAGLIPAILLVTGFVMWWQRSVKRWLKNFFSRNCS